ncbi:hypothetical protein MAPG_09032 [Magnaporthiopsis poae ATCC 64411]|uniref:Uncharacterized protein n=1 Tax=Magnaporthiopsis poae (strain ATCC 64411 / 73-15) TaxID=644358 RepID=A0A0C4E8W2_MAGP6|nr:hypothetical protein MAPG_09032 [Magnaporthiopsis poae ATCC 64411]
MEPSPQATKEATSTAEALSAFDQHPNPTANTHTPLAADSDEAHVFASLVGKGTSNDATAERLTYMCQHAHDSIGYVPPSSSFIQIEGKRYYIKIKVS